jgi:hypothetical protein
MRIQTATICLAAVTIAFSSPTECSAGPRDRSNQAPTTILPSRQEVAAVPVPDQGRVLAYPREVARYGGTVLPSARVVRGFFGR